MIQKKESPPCLGDDPLVIRMRLERMTVCLEGRCSIQLSYRTDLVLSLCKGTLLIGILQIFFLTR